MRCVSVFLAALTTALSAPAGPPADYKASSVKVSLHAPGGVAHHGSGTVVKAAGRGFWVLTCQHVFDRAGEASVTTAGGARLPASLLAADRGADLALLAAEGEAPVKAARLADLDDYPGGERTVNVGWGTGSHREVKGSLVGTNRMANAPRLANWLSSVGAVEGDSGGGLFRESDGALIGVVWGGKSQSHARPLVDLRAFLAKAEQQPPAKDAAPPAKDAPPTPPAKGGPRPGPSRTPPKAPPPPPLFNGEPARVLPPFTRYLYVDVENLKTRHVQIGNRFYKVVVEEVTPAAEKAPGKTPDKLPPPKKEAVPEKE